MWNVKATLAQSLAFLVFASMEENILSICYSSWYVREVRNLSLFYQPRAIRLLCQQETASSDIVKYVLTVVKVIPEYIKMNDVKYYSDNNELLYISWISWRICPLNYKKKVFTDSRISVF